MSPSNARASCCWPRTRSGSVGVGITLAAASELQEGVTYLLPLRATSSTEGITLSEKAQHAVYLVKDLRAQGDAYKGPDAVRNVCYFEVNDTNPLNALEFVLKDSGKLFFDDIILFSANINYNAETGRVYVLNNPNVQFLLDNNEQFLQPLRKRGMKVILGILGNHDAAGVAQLSDMAAVSSPRSWRLIATPIISTASVSTTSIRLLPT